MDDSFMLIALLGSIVGLAIGMTGVGGGTLGVPLLTIAVGIPVSECVGTALLFSTIVKSYTTFRYYLRNNVDGPVFLRLLAGGFPGVIAGSLLMRYIADGGANRLITAIVGAIIVVTTGVSLYRTFGEIAVIPRSRYLIGCIACFIGLETGFSSAGAGALGTVLLFNTTTLAPATVVGTDLAFGLALSFTGGLVHASAGNWRPDLLIPFVGGGLVGAFFGVALARVVPPKRMRQIALTAAMLLGATLVWKVL